jgi:succinate dehydrogenase/fumarate reductase flavoprotein subunit
VEQLGKAPDTDEATCDLLVVGSGAGALTAALTAAQAGLQVLVLEKEHCFGGASARSGGGLWVPGNRICADAGHADSRADMLTYLRHEAGALYDEDKVAAFLDHGPQMVDFVIDQTRVAFAPVGISDYHPHHPGGKAAGRAIMATSIDARPMGDLLGRLRPPLKAATFLGMQIGIEDFGHFAMATRRLRSFAHVARLIVRRLVDQVLNSRSMRLTSGNALVAGLAERCVQLGVELRTGAPVRSLQQVDGMVTGAVAEAGGRLLHVHARKGVVLATGGFPHDGPRRADLFPTGAMNDEVWALMPHGNSGDGLRMGEAAGGRVERGMRSAVALSPVMRIDDAEGAMSCFPVFTTRGNPGKIAVRRDGRRFVNEASSYHDFAAGMIAAAEGEQEAVAWIVSDQRSLRRYGLGVIHPTLPIGRHLRSGILLKGNTLRELALRAGIDPVGLEDSVARFNRHARDGIDPDFGRGGNAYDLWAGDPRHWPCPCLGPLEHKPFYAIRVFAGSVGTFAGLVTNGRAQVLDKQGTPIAGLYATGNDLASITGGDYIGGGCTLGPAMTFGFIAGRQAAGS